MSKIKCQMPKVNKVKLLSERTSGAPPVIFCIYLQIDLSILPVDFFQSVTRWVPFIGDYQHTDKYLLWPNYNVQRSAGL